MWADFILLICPAAVLLLALAYAVALNRREAPDPKLELMDSLFRLVADSETPHVHRSAA